MGQYQQKLDEKNIIDKELSDQITDFRQSTYYFEWASDPPTNGNFSSAIGNAKDLVDKLNALRPASK